MRALDNTRQYKTVYVYNEIKNEIIVFCILNVKIFTLNYDFPLFYPRFKSTCTRLLETGVSSSYCVPSKECNHAFGTLGYT